MEDSLLTKLIAVCSCVLFLVVGAIFLWYSSNIRMLFVLVIFAFLALAPALRVGKQQNNRRSLAFEKLCKLLSILQDTLNDYYDYSEFRNLAVLTEYIKALLQNSDIQRQNDTVHR